MSAAPVSWGANQSGHRQEGHSRHRDFLRWTCLHTADASVIRQRKLTLYGVRARQTPEDEHEHQMRGELRLLLPEVFGGLSHVQ